MLLHLFLLCTLTVIIEIKLNSKFDAAVDFFSKHKSKNGN